MGVGACRSRPSRLSPGPRGAFATSRGELSFRIRGIALAVLSGMKSLPIPVARVRGAFADVLEDAKRGRRIRITRHGKPVGWLIGADEREQLLRAQRGKSSRAPRSRGR